MNSRRDYQLIQSQVIGGVHTIIQLAICKVSGSTKQPPLWALHRSHHLLGQCQIIYCFLHPFPSTKSDLSVQIGLVSTQSNISNIYSFLTPSWIFLFSLLFIIIISSPRNPIPTTWVCYRTELLKFVVAQLSSLCRVQTQCSITGKRMSILKCMSNIVSTSRKLYTQIYLVNNESCTPSVHLGEHTFKHMAAEIEYILPAFFLN